MTVLCRKHLENHGFEAETTQFTIRTRKNKTHIFVDKFFTMLCQRLGWWCFLTSLCIIARNDL